MFVIVDNQHGHWGLASSLTFPNTEGAEEYARVLTATYPSVREFHIYELVNPVVIKRREEVVATVI